MTTIVKIIRFYAEYHSLFHFEDQTIPNVPKFFEDKEYRTPSNELLHHRNADENNMNEEENVDETDEKKGAYVEEKRVQWYLNIQFIGLAIFNFVTRYLFCEHDVAPIYFLIIPVIVALTPSKRRDMEVLVFATFLFIAFSLLALKPLLSYNNNFSFSSFSSFMSHLVEFFEISICTDDIRLFAIAGIPMSMFFMVMLYHNHIVKLNSIVNEKRYRQYSILLETIISNLPATLWTVDKNLNITFSRGEQDALKNRNSRKLTDLIGMPIKEYCSKHLHLTEDEIEEFIEKHQAAIKTGQISTHLIATTNYSRQRSNGFMDLTESKDHTISHYTTLIAPWTNRNGERIGAVGLSYDISEFVHAREALLKSEENYRMLIHSLNDVIIRVDRDHLISMASKELIGISPNSLIGKNVLDVLYKNDKETYEKAQNYLETLFETKQPCSWEWTIQNGNESSIYSITATLIGTDWATLIMSDVTAQRNSQRNLLFAQQAKIASKSKSAFIASMSHEVRNPLQAIMGSLQLLSTTEMTRVQMEYLEDASENAKVLLAIISDVLDMSKIESDRLELFLSPFSVMDVIETTADMLSLQCYEKELEILTEVDTSLPTQLIGDKTRIGQILSNFTMNSIKFTKPGGLITLRVQNLEENENSNKIAISCTDTGIGIKKEDIDKLFRPFIQLNYDNTLEERDKENMKMSHSIDADDKVVVEVNESIGESHHYYKGYLSF